jgi:signal transduction histidine kinase
MRLNEPDMEHAVENLVRNAVEAGARQIDVRTESEGDAVRVVVADDGHGIPQAQADRLFDPFFTTRRDSGGTGLGLSLVHSIVRGHGGTIHVDSSPGKGSRFTIRIPLRKEAAEGTM